MENFRAYSCLNAVLILSLLLLSAFRVNGQISTACTSSMISSFTPCFNFLTGSSGSGSSPTAECCNSLKNLTSDSMDCTCLIVTGNVPVSIPFISRTLAISLPGMCNSNVPLQCKATGVALPASGPALFAPTQAPVAHAPHAHRPTQAPVAHAPHAHRPTQAHAPHAHRPTQAHAPHAHRPTQAHAPHAHSTRASKATAAAAPPAETPLDITPAAPPEVSLAPTENPGIRPVLTPNSASNPSIFSLSSLLIMLVGIMVLKLF